MVKLIPLSYLNEACFLTLNVDEKKYSMVLKLAQSDLKDVLGGEFYAEIISQYPSSLSSDNDTLYEDYIKDFLAWQTYAHYLKFSQADSTATGIRTFKDENSELATDIRLYSFEKNVVNTANDYRQKMINFLLLSQNQDSTKYPKWKNTSRVPFSFGFGIIERGNKDNIISVNKTQRRNE